MMGHEMKKEEEDVEVEYYDIVDHIDSHALDHCSERTSYLPRSRLRMIGGACCICVLSLDSSFVVD